ncbi:MAG: SUMF1/EgtB/PvdO family nonheme iron enzyme [Phycisphaerales bacterium]|jgi:formylglycine-generating enzyme required for sulfatase activity|nr:SUMF1/EgtB/PvdO family nonheme iron enzyme [Phycisphaerales bacterium]
MNYAVRSGIAVLLVLAFGGGGVFAAGADDIKLISEMEARKKKIAQAQQLRLSGLNLKLQDNPKDTAVREQLILFFLVGFDNIDAAVKLLNDDVDEGIRTYVSLAAKPPSSLPESACLELGAWYYRVLTKDALPVEKLPLLKRANTYYERFLQLHPKKDIQAARVRSDLQRIRESITKYDEQARQLEDKTIMLHLGKGGLMKFIRVPAGRFTMGSHSREVGRGEDEGPQRQVAISKPFYMGQIEVTQQQYQSITGKNPSRFKGPYNPVDQVSWSDATAFCQALSKKTGLSVRLPTEPQWEYACRAGTTARFSMGQDSKFLGLYAWYSGNSVSATHPAAQSRGDAQSEKYTKALISGKMSEARKLYSKANAIERAKKPEDWKEQADDLRGLAGRLITNAKNLDAVELRKRAEKHRATAKKYTREAQIIIRARKKDWRDRALSKKKYAERYKKYAAADDARAVVVKAYRKKPNTLGLYDMHGNVWEWCRDYYDAKFYASGKNVDPENTKESASRVCRGGAWSSSSTNCRSAKRAYRTSGSARSYIGFRVMIEAVRPKPAPPAKPKTLTLDLGKNVTMKLVRIPAGKFVMGTPAAVKQRRQAERPAHAVTISKPFYMGVYEVTQTQYQAVTGVNRSKFKGPQDPVGVVSWQEAEAFCKAVSKKTGRNVHLPSEAQWEYACRAGTTTCYSFGQSDKDLAAYGWCKDNADGRTHPVGRKKPNAFGLYDMHGNVMEWCYDWYDSGFYAKAKNVDPVNIKDSGRRVLRGGSILSRRTTASADMFHARSAIRSYTTPSNAYYFIGFRVVVSEKTNTPSGK